jgi:hypothetical protein
MPPGNSRWDCGPPVISITRLTRPPCCHAMQLVHDSRDAGSNRRAAKTYKVAGYNGTGTTAEEAAGARPGPEPDAMEPSNSVLTRTCTTCCTLLEFRRVAINSQLTLS